MITNSTDHNKQQKITETKKMRNTEIHRMTKIQKNLYYDIQLKKMMLEEIT